MKTSPQFLTNAFVYQPEKIDVGALYFYIKSNLDGSWPARIFIYVASKTHLEVLKVEPGDEIVSLVTADMDWTTFSADHFESWFILPDDVYNGQPVPAPGLMSSQAFGSHSSHDHFFAMGVPGGRGSVFIEHYPFHVYNFDFTSLNMAFCHLVDPERPFEIGVVDPNWPVLLAANPSELGGDANLMQYRGKALIEFLCDEPCHGKACRKYRISGKGMDGKEGFFWVNKEIGCFENFEHPLYDNPNWNSFKLELQSIDHLTEIDWIAFIDAERKRNLVELRNPGSVEPK